MNVAFIIKEWIIMWQVAALLFIMANNVCPLKLCKILFKLFSCLRILYSKEQQIFNTLVRKQWIDIHSNTAHALTSTK